MIVQTAAKNDTNFFTAQPFDKGMAEEACFETILPADSVAAPAPRPSPDDDGIAILQSRDYVQGRMPGFGYWLLVALVAVSVFWISGGHTLLTPR